MHTVEAQQTDKRAAANRLLRGANGDDCNLIHLSAREEFLLGAKLEKYKIYKSHGT